MYLNLLMMAATMCGGALEDGFVNPPHSAKPHTWYHMMNGNVTKEGITRDFEALADEGFGGVQMFDAGCNIPPGGLDFNSPEWFDMFRHAAAEARRLGLEICIPNCSGWSSSGGPWNPPSNGMKRVVFSETHVKGPSRFNAKLPRERNDHGFYEDIAVTAFPTPPAERATFDGVETKIDGLSFTIAGGKPFVASGISFDLAFGYVWYGDAELAIEVSADGKTFVPLAAAPVILARSGSCDHSLRFHAFASPITARIIRGAFTCKGVAPKLAQVRPEAAFFIPNIKSKMFDVRHEVSATKAVVTPRQTVAKDAVRDLTAKLARDGTLQWEVPPGDWTILRIGHVCTGRKNHPASDHGAGLEVDKLSASAMDYHFEQYVARLCRTLGPLAGQGESGFNNILVDSYEVGSQNWTQGFEKTFRSRCGCDLAPYLPVFSGRVVGGVEESERFLEDFRRTVADLFAENYAGKLTAKCREYGLMCSIEPYGSCPVSNLQYGQRVDIPMGEFWSHAGNPYNTDSGNTKFVSHVAHVWGKKICGAESFSACPSATDGRWLTMPFSIKAQGDRTYCNGVNRFIYHRYTHQPWPDDKYLPGMTMGRWGMHLDRTQTWWPYAKPFFRYQARCQYMLQRGTFVADVLFFEGEGTPSEGGNTCGVGHPTFDAHLAFGYDYDVCPTDAMHALRVEDGEVVVPGGVRYRVLALPSDEAMSPKMLRTLARLQREGAKIAWREKPTRALGLSWGPEGDAEVRKLADEIFASDVLRLSAGDALQALGVEPQFKVVGKLPPGVWNWNFGWIHRREREADWFFTSMPNREPAELELSFRVSGRIPEIWDAETGRMAPAGVWREENGRTIVTVPYDVCGSKFVVFRKPSASVVHYVGVKALQKGGADSPGGREIPPLPYEFRADRDGGVVRMWARKPLTAVFTDSCGRERKVSADVPAPIVVEGPWQVAFPNGFLPNPLARGEDESVVFDKLGSWSERQEEGVRYFSGTATYRKKVVLAQPVPQGVRVVLDLGSVREFAEVTVNGRTFDALWRPPYRVDVTDALAGSSLDVSIRVANLWANRLIGDDIQCAPDCEWVGTIANGVKELGIKEIPKWVKEGKASPTGRHTFTTWKHWDKNDKLLPSGLLGPVKLRFEVEAK